MPSLRRSFSSPSVRSSPYPPSLSSSSAPTTRSRPNPRRSSGSATAERRVLADIEWWRVYDGQCDQDHIHDGAHEPDADVSSRATVMLSAGGGPLEPPPQSHTFSLDAMQYVYPDALAALSIAPHSPPGSRDSSVESTPELPTVPLETVQLGLTSPASCPLGDLFPSSLMRNRHPLFGLRSVSAPNPSHHQRTLAPDFADMGGDSFSLDQNLFQ